MSIQWYKYIQLNKNLEGKYDKFIYITLLREWVDKSFESLSTSLLYSVIIVRIVADVYEEIIKVCKQKE